ncbi:MAG TPA: L,D-transpeptidase family protein [Chthoniobacterales bacterium]|nr:L,D-transpeptidase family protein [Chthoniobacterales bacterium]
MMNVERKGTNSRNLIMRCVVHVCFCLVAAAATAAFIRAQNFSRLPDNPTIDRMVVEKSARKLSVFRDGKLWKTYAVALGGNPIGHKQEEGDMKTPEGVYTIDYRNPQSDFHLALHVSYPSAEDTARAAERGVSAGGDIMIHGLPNGQGSMADAYRNRDWTLGCIAVTDEEIEELWRITPDGTPIEIRP